MLETCAISMRTPGKGGGTRKEEALIRALSCGEVSSFPHCARFWCISRVADSETCFQPATETATETERERKNMYLFLRVPKLRLIIDQRACSGGLIVVGEKGFTIPDFRCPFPTFPFPTFLPLGLHWSWPVSLCSQVCQLSVGPEPDPCLAVYGSIIYQSVCKWVWFIQWAAHNFILCPLGASISHSHSHSHFSIYFSFFFFFISYFFLLFFRRFFVDPFCLLSPSRCLSVSVSLHSWFDSFARLGIRDMSHAVRDVACYKANHRCGPLQGNRRKKKNRKKEIEIQKNTKKKYKENWINLKYICGICAIIDRGCAAGSGSGAGAAGACKI